MPQARTNGIVIEYEIAGPEDGAPLLLIHGVGAQLIRWPDALLDRFAEAGFRTIRFDNRDSGLSTHFGTSPSPDIAAIIAARARGEEPELPYTLADMAADSLGLLDVLGIEQAHVLGMSLGGMIAQAMALAQPARVLSLALVMTNSGNPGLPPSDAEALRALAVAPPDPVADREAHLAHMTRRSQILGSPSYPTPESALRRFAALAADRCFDPGGVTRQTAASRGAPDRREALRALSVPTLVVHGADDRLIPAEAGDELAALIADTWLLRIRGMGHDLPAQLFDLIVPAVKANADRAA